MLLDIIIISAILIAIFSILILVILITIRQSKKYLYDQERSRAMLDAFRSSIESQNYKMNSLLENNEARWKEINHLILNAQYKSKEKISITYKVHLNNFLKELGLTDDDLEIEKDLVFILTPFHKDKRYIYDVIRTTCENIGLRCKRGDEEFLRGEILQHIIKLIVKARVVIANIEGRNPNVFYELGIAHAIDKPVIIISSSLKEVSFDIKSKRIILYDNVEELSRRLEQYLTRALISE